MNGEHDQSSDVIARLNAGDPAASDELFTRIYPRLVQLARLMLGSFYDLNGQHLAESLVHTAWIDLHTALLSIKPESLACYRSLAAKKMRLALLDLAKKDRRRRDTIPLDPRTTEDDGSSPNFYPSASSSCDPGRLEIWARFHEAVGELPDDLREVFEAYFYTDEKPNQARTAELLGMPPRQAGRLIAKARFELATRLGGLGHLLS
jgi:RNA polymerase sigma factor (sigma-70 family)